VLLVYTQAMKKHDDKSGFAGANGNKETDCGFDVEMLKDNLKRTVAERIRRHQIALNTVKKLRGAKRL